MINIQSIRQSTPRVFVIGNDEAIIQSILDFDFLSGKKQGSVQGIITGRRGVAKYFWGRQEILLPTFATLPPAAKGAWFLSLTSGRRTLTTALSALENGCVGSVLFAENVPELHSLQLIDTVAGLHRGTPPLLIGPASVGLVVPGFLKLGPIGGITPTQIAQNYLTQSGSVAVLSASGGMTNELINIAVGEGHHLSFALSFGGDRFPILSPRDAFLLAESDPATKTILYYGELGGQDEYELVKLKEAGKFTKHVIAHIAGTVASLFPESPQFGHAKAKADKEAETALSKREALQGAGFLVSNSFSDFIQLVSKLNSRPTDLADLTDKPTN